MLDGEIFDTLLEAKVMIERWRKEYNTVRPHSSLDYRAPVPETKLIQSDTKSCDWCNIRGWVNQGGTSRSQQSDFCVSTPETDRRCRQPTVGPPRRTVVGPSSRGTSQSRRFDLSRDCTASPGSIRTRSDGISERTVLENVAW